jgi:GxxExxY protein
MRPLMEICEPQAQYEGYKHADLTQRIIGIFYDVYNELGWGFLEKVYENAIVLRLQACGLRAAQQKPISVHFDGVVIGEYFADVVVEDLVLLELKAVDSLTGDHEAQVLNYLRATKYEVGLLLNFGPKPKVVRKAFNNDRKPNLERSS